MGKIQTVSKYMKWEISVFFLEVTTYISLPQVWFQPLGLRDEVPGVVCLVGFIHSVSTGDKSTTILT